MQILLALLFAVGIRGTAQETRKLALIIAISDYPADGGYPRINASRDVALVRGALLTQGFDSTSIRVLRDAEATRAGILSAIEGLIARAAEGDVVVLHYSGHGHRISDDNGDELDGLDELLVPYDAPALIRPGSGYHGERHIRDDELAPLLAALRARVGARGSVTVFLDACYSGSATRGGPGEAVVRGVAEPLIVSGARPTRNGSDSGAGALEPRLRGEIDPAPLAPLVVISAARHDQVAREAYDAERHPVGSLSLALSVALPRVVPGETWRGLFDRVAVTMAGMNLYDQRPQIEGTADALVLSGQIVEQKPYYRVVAVLGDSAVRLRGGMVLGLIPGTRIELYPSGTTDPAHASLLASGVVVASDPGSAEVRLSSWNGAAAVLGTAWAFVTEYAYGDLALRVRLDRRLGAATQQLVRKSLAPLRSVTLDGDQPDLRIEPASTASPSAVAIVPAAGGSPLGGSIALGSPGGEAALRERLLGYSRSSMLRRLDLSDPRIAVKMELIRTKPRIQLVAGARQCDGTVPVPLLMGPLSSDGLALAPDDEFTLRLTNEGRDPAYVAILELLPGGGVSQAFPGEASLGSDNYLPPGASFVIQDLCFFAEPPYGTEVVKLFATRERFDFSPILSGGATRGELSPLGQLFADAVQGTRGTLSAQAGWGSTSSLSFLIVPKVVRP